MNKVSSRNDDDEIEGYKAYMEDVWSDVNKDMFEHCLIEKLILRKPCNLEAMKTTFFKAW